MSNNLTCTLGQVEKLLPLLLKSKTVPFLHSSPGIGKSSLARKIAKKNNLKFIDIRLSDRDPSDLNGLPFFENGKARFMPFDTFPLKGDPLPVDENGKPMNGWLINYDEFNSASQATQAAAYKLILDQQVGDHDLHEKVFQIACGNLEDDNAIVNEMSSALISRFAHFYIELSHDQWMEWAALNQVDMKIRAYLGFRPSHLYTFNPDSSSPYACPRTWEMLSNATKGIEVTRDHIPLLASLVGQGVATEYLAFLRLFSQLPSFETILANPEGVQLSGKIDIQWALMTMVTQRIDDKNAKTLVKFLRRLSMELQACAMREISVTNPNLLQNHLSEWLLELSKEIFE